MAIEFCDSLVLCVRLDSTPGSEIALSCFRSVILVILVTAIPLADDNKFPHLERLIVEVA